eukprot:768440-Hanusia_phi.AAC.3
MSHVPSPTSALPAHSSFSSYLHVRLSTCPPFFSLPASLPPPVQHASYLLAAAWRIPLRQLSFCSKIPRTPLRREKYPCCIS